MKNIQKNTKEYDIHSSGRDFCQYAKKCGGCQLQNMDYPRQLAFKQATVVKAVGKYARVSPIIGMEYPYHYRNKVQAAFGLTRNKKVISGVYQSSSHQIVNVNECKIEDKLADQIIVDIRHMLVPLGIVPYNEDSRKGFLRHVLVKRGFSTNQIMVVLVGANTIFPQKSRFVKQLLEKHPEITTIVFNVNGSNTSILLGHKQEVLYGNGYIEDILCGYRFRISPKSFFQVNPIQTEKLYSIAMEYANLQKEELVIDAYCGTGTIGIVASEKAKNVLGIEINIDAIHDAITNAKLNHVKNIQFINADAGEKMDEITSAGEKVDVVFMDPPRAGSDMKFLKSLCNLSPQKIIYISCNPITLSRDLFTLVKNRYKVKKIQPVDMFPHTKHVETVVLLTKK